MADLSPRSVQHPFSDGEHLIVPMKKHEGLGQWCVKIFDINDVLNTAIPFTEQGEPNISTLPSIMVSKYKPGEGMSSDEFLPSPSEIFSDGEHLFVVDSELHKVLIWNEFPTVNDTLPDIEIGSGNISIAKDSLFQPHQIWFDRYYLWVGDRKFSGRLMRFPVKPIPHDPIYINGNNDFGTQASNENWTGNGTEGNPYIIEGWDINASATNGIDIRNTDVYFIIRNCKIHNNSDGGIYFHMVEYSTVSNNCISDNQYGIFLDSCNDNVFDSNVITGSVNGDGVSMDSSTSNTLVNNTIESNKYTGIGLWSSSENLVYHNNLIDNSPNGYDDVGTNSWDNGAEGNYWSDYSGTDEDGDGIGDTAYDIANGAGAKDNYPFMDVSGWVTEVENQPPVPSFSYSPENPVVNQTMTFDASASYDTDGNITKYEWNFGDGNITSTTEAIITHSYSSAGEYNVSLTMTDDGGLTNSTSKTVTINPVATTVFDTGSGTYPSISGTHNGTITPNQDITVQKIYTYPCSGTGGHTEHVTFYYSDGTKLAEGRWNGYTEDWHNISFDPAFTLHAGEKYNYTIRTGSYPQIIHEHEYKNATGGTITCTSFVDANGKTYTDWIPAIMLE